MSRIGGFEAARPAARLFRFFYRRPTAAEVAAAVDSSNRYDAESPDELALVKAADAYGFTLISRSANEIRVRLPSAATRTPPGRPPTSGESTIHEAEMEFVLLKVLQFDSDRKRMSVLLRLDDGSDDGSILLLCKGADEQVLPRLAPSSITAERLDGVRRSLEAYGRAGLRTLCMAMRVVPEDEYLKWIETRTWVSA